MRPWYSELAALHDQGKEIVVVSSGAVAAGMTRLGRTERPQSIPEKQALAAVGQIRLMALYERAFAKFDKNVAQVLLTHEDLANRQRYLNAKHTFQMLLASSIIPIVNENDTVAVEEMKFGDNDHLSALVATLLEADLLVILSDVAGVYDRDPRLNTRCCPRSADSRHQRNEDTGDRLQPKRLRHRRHGDQNRRRRRSSCGRHPHGDNQRTDGGYDPSRVRPQ